MSVFNSSRLAGKTVLITGASSGIGKHTAILFARAGANVILAARREDALVAAKEMCIAAHKEGGAKAGGQFATMVLDVSHYQTINSLWDKIPSGFPDIDILVNNAAFALGVEHIGNIADSDIEAMFSTNVMGLIAMTQQFVRYFKKLNTGHIINIGSIAGLEPYVGGSIYCATKHAVDAFNGSLRRELVQTPIRVSQILPGLTETEFSMVRYRGDDAAAKKVYEGIHALTGEDIAEEIVWVASRPPHVNICDVALMPVNQASVTLYYRTSQ